MSAILIPEQTLRAARGEDQPEPKRLAPLFILAAVIAAAILAGEYLMGR